MPTITSRHNPLVARVRAILRGESAGLMLLDGVHLVADALDAGCRIQEAAVSVSEQEADPEVNALVRRLRDRDVAISSVSATVMQALSPVRSSSPIVALAVRPEERADQVFRSSPPALVLIAVGIQDPGNLGAIVRVAEAAGASGVVAADRSADPFGWKALRGAMGGTFRLPVLIRPAAADAINEAKRRGCRIVATSPRTARSVFDADLTGPRAILIGAEGAGLADSIAMAADERVAIPMEGPVESLNAAVTAALIAYEARRQRTTGRSKDRPLRT